MKRNIIAIIMGVLCVAVQVSASEQDAYTAAGNFLRYRNSGKVVIKLIPLEFSSITSDSAQVYGYRAQLSAGGYLLISESKNVLPIKAFSLSNDFDNLPRPYRDFLLHKMQDLFNVVSTGRFPQTVGEASNAWGFLLNPGRLPLSYTPDSFLLKTTWAQGYPYNKFLPEVGGKHVLVGCVNVAIAQILKYHQWPTSGKGVVYNNWNGKELRSILYHPLDFVNMPLDLTALNESSMDVDKAARLLADLGIANKTDFGVDNSGAFFDPSVLIDYFGYAPSIQHVNSTESTFYTTIQYEINNNRPILISIPGHMAVVDGYSSESLGSMIHLNLGWGGIADSFYYFDKDIVAGGYTFPVEGIFDLYYGITPCKTAECGEILEVDDNMTATGVSGVFDYADDVDLYEVYLKGSVNLAGDRGYLNQAFYINLYDNDGRRLFGGNSTITSPNSLPSGRYLMGISLKDKQGTNYDYSADVYANYTVTIEGQRLTSSEIQEVALELDHPPEFVTALPESIVLNKNSIEPYKLFLDVRDPDNDPVVLSFSASNPQAVSVTIDGRVLIVTPLISGVSSKITITASANNKQITGSINVLVGDGNTAFGSSFTVKGVFASIDSLHEFPVILDGNCTIKGDRGYVSQAFFTGVSEGSQILIADDNVTITNNFTAGLYTIRASLTSSNSYYDYTTGEFDTFTLSGQCPDYTLSLEQLAALLEINIDGLTTAGTHVTSITDLLTILKIMVGHEDVSFSKLQDLDLNKDGKLNMGDLILICKGLVGS